MCACAVATGLHEILMGEFMLLVKTVVLYTFMFSASIGASWWCWNNSRRSQSSGKCSLHALFQCKIVVLFSNALESCKRKRSLRRHANHNPNKVMLIGWRPTKKTARLWAYDQQWKQESWAFGPCHTPRRCSSLMSCMMMLKLGEAPSYIQPLLCFYHPMPTKELNHCLLIFLSAYLWHFWYVCILMGSGICEYV